MSDEESIHIKFSQLYKEALKVKTMGDDMDDNVCPICGAFLASIDAFDDIKMLFYSYCGQLIKLE